MALMYILYTTGPLPGCEHKSLPEQTLIKCHYDGFAFDLGTVLFLVFKLSVEYYPYYSCLFSGLWVC